MATSDSRAIRSAQAPIAKRQITSLRKAAMLAFEAAAGGSEATDIYDALTANILAGLALELGLKMFYMTYCDKVARGHSLQELFEQLPAQMRGDIDETYRNSWPEAAAFEIKLYALRRSPEQPEKPDPWQAPLLAEAANVFTLASDAFVSSRYFFENVSSDDWAIVVCPVRHMVAMIEVLDCVYDAYIERKGWR